LRPQLFRLVQKLWTRDGLKGAVTRLVDYAVRDAAQSPLRMSSQVLWHPGKLCPPKTPEMEIFQTQAVREQVKPSRVRGEVVVREFLIPTLTETLPVLSPGTMSVLLGESWDTEKEYNRPPVRSYTPSLLPCLWWRCTLFRISQLLLLCKVNPPLPTSSTNLSLHRLPSSLRTDSMHGLHDWTVSSEHLRYMFLVSSLFFFLFGSVRQTKLATRQLLGAR